MQKKPEAKLSLEVREETWAHPTELGRHHGYRELYIPAPTRVYNSAWRNPNRIWNPYIYNQNVRNQPLR